MELQGHEMGLEIITELYSIGDIYTYKLMLENQRMLETNLSKYVTY
jgi:hypothetical protein